MRVISPISLSWMRWWSSCSGRAWRDMRRAATLGAKRVAGGAGAAPATTDERDLHDRVTGGVDVGDDNAGECRGGGDLANALAEITAGEVGGGRLGLRVVQGDSLRELRVE